MYKEPTIIEETHASLLAQNRELDRDDNIAIYNKQCLLLTGYPLKPFYDDGNVNVEICTNDRFSNNIEYDIHVIGKHVDGLMISPEKVPSFVSMLKKNTPTHCKIERINTDRQGTITFRYQCDYNATISAKTQTDLEKQLIQFMKTNNHDLQNEFSNMLK